MSSLRITKPNAGEKVTLSIPADSAGQAAAIGFATSGVNVERAGNDLVFQFGDGAETRVADFFVTGGKALPDFVLEDGTTISSADVLKQLNENIDLETAAGPGSGGNTGSGGAGEYADDAGALIDGVNALGFGGALGQWGGVEASSEIVPLTINLPLQDISASLFGLNEDMFAPANSWANGGTLLVGVISAMDPEGQTITYGLSPAVQNATIVTDDGSVLVLGTYRIDPATGELFIDLIDYTGNPAGQTVAEALANSLRADGTYSLSQAVVTLTDGVNDTTLTVSPVASGMNDVPVMDGTAGLADGFTEAGFETAYTNTLTGTLDATDADYGERQSSSFEFKADMANASCVTDNTANTAPSIGKYGDFVLQPDGTWTFESGPAHAQAISQLRHRETVTITIPVYATDPQGADSAPENLVITITGTNDRPLMTSNTPDLTGAFTEAGYESAGYNLTVDGQLSFTDDDLGDTHVFGNDTPACSSTNNANGSPVASDYGDFTLNTATGEWEFVSGPAHQSAINSLREGETITITVPVYVTDNSGAADAQSISQNVVITITGTNDRPVMTTPSGQLTFTVTEDAIETAGYPYDGINGTLTATDDDLGDTLTFGSGTANCVSDNAANASPVAADYGDFTLNTATGAWSFVPTTQAQQDAINALKDGEVLTITIPVYVTDDSGASDAQSAGQTITITIIGSNDAPFLTSAVGAFDVGEHGKEWVSGAENSTDFGFGAGLDVAQFFDDVDTGDTLSYSLGTVDIGSSDGAKLAASDLAALQSYLATGTLTGDSFDFTGNFPALDSLKAGETVTVTIPVTATDGSGASVTKDVTVTIHGVNDGPVRTGVPSVFEVSEHGKEWISGAEGGNAFTFNTMDVTQFFSDVDVNDTLSYSLGGVIMSPGVATELSAADQTALANFFASGNMSLSNGQFSFTGSFPTLDSLAHGKSVSVSIPVTATDESGATVTQNVTFTINGVNDDTTVDNGNKVVVHMSESGKEWDPSATPGNEEGANDFALSYDAAQHFDDVDQGDTITYSINGVALSGDTSSLSAAELAALNANLSKLFSIDPATGQLTYDASKLTDVTRLANGEVIKVTVTVKGTDGMTATAPTKDIELNIHGTETGPQIIGSDASLTEPGDVTWWTGGASSPNPTSPTDLSGKSTEVNLSFADADTGDTVTVSITCGSNTATFTVDHTGAIQGGATPTVNGDWGQLRYEGGKWIYEAFNKADTLNDGQNGTDTFAVTASDGSHTANSNLTVTVTGQDDAPVAFDKAIDHTQPAQILGPYLGSNATSTLDGTLNLMDVDDNDNTIAFQVKDPATGLYVNGVNTGTTANPVYEYDLQYGTLTIKYVPGSDAFDAMGVTGADGGKWVYEYEFTAPKTSENINKSLSEPISIKAYDPDLPGQTVDLDFDINIVTTSFDSNLPKPVYDVLRYDLESGDVLFGIGQNPAPYAPGNDSLLGNDNTINGDPAATHNGSGWDCAPGLSVEGKTVSTPYGNLTINADGTFSFNPDLSHADIVGLKSGESLSISIPYTVTENSKPFTSYLIVQIDGKNDAPEIGSGGLRFSTEHGFGDTDGIIHITDALATDVDGDKLTFTFYQNDGVTEVTGSTVEPSSTFDPTDYAGVTSDHSFDPGNDLTQTVALDPGCKAYDFEYGWLVEKADGSFDFVVNRNHPDVVKLGKGESLDVEIKYSASDGSETATGGSIKVTINGDYDKLAVKDLNHDTLNGAYFKTEQVDDGTGNMVDKATYQYGASRGNSIQDDGSGNLKFVENNDSFDFDNAAHSGGGSAGQQYFLSSLKQLVASLDGSGAQTYTFSTSGNNIYGIDANTGEKVFLGNIRISNGNLIFSGTNSGDWEEIWSKKGYFTEIFVDANCTKKFELYVTSSDDPAGTKTTIDVDFAIRYADDSPVVSSVRLSHTDSEGKVIFHDVDTKAEDLTLYVEDKNGNLQEIAADGTTVDVGHGTITMNKDGSFDYTRTDGQTDSQEIRVVVGDGNSATKGLITVEGSTAATPTGNIVDDTFKFNFGSNNTLNAQHTKNIFTNDTGVEHNMLNAGTYILDNVVIKGAGADTSSFDCTRFGNNTTQVSESFSLEAGSRFEMVLSNCVLTFESNGTLQYQLTPSVVKLYDTISGDYFTFTYTNAFPAFQAIADRLGMTVQEVRDALEFSFEYQAQDSVTGEVITGNINFDWGGSYANGGQYYSDNVKQEANLSIFNFDSSFDGNSTGSTGHVEDIKIKGTGSYIATDLNGDAVYLRIATVDANGNPTWQAYSSDTLIDQAKANGGVEYKGNSIVPKDTTNLSIEIPVYAWVKVDPVTGEISVQTATPSNLADWNCVQVGTATWTPTAYGSRSVIGYDNNGNAIYADIANNVTGDISLALLQANTSGDLQAFHDYIRGMSEAQRQNLLFFYMGTKDDGNVSGTGKILVSVFGTDVVLGDGNLPVQLTSEEGDLIANGFTVDILSGAKHTVVNSTDSTSRTDIDGWDRFEFAGGQSGRADTNHEIEGQYGKLVWDKANGKYQYELYNDADYNAKHGVTTGNPVPKMVDGQNLTETFDYTVYDKNGESDSGQTVITIEGKSDGFELNFPADGKVQITEGNNLNVSLSDYVATQDGGEVRYYIEYTDPVTGLKVNTFLTPSGGATEEINTMWGRLVFSPTTGAYTFTPNGILQHGETVDLGIKVYAEITTVVNGQEKKQNSGWNDLDIEITGVNDAPEMGNGTFFASADNELGAFGWKDIDNDVNDGGFFFDAWSASDQGSSAGGLETVTGQYGNLIVTSNTGSFRYELHNDAFNGGASRVVDEFSVKVTDPGDAQGANQMTSDEGKLTVYAVNGSYQEGTAGADSFVITDGKSHIIEGGAGNDVINLTGAGDENVLIWNAGDQGTGGSPAIDTVKGFHLGDLTDADTTNDGDMLDLRGLLGDLLETGTSLADIISFEVSGGHTTINIASGSDTTQPVQQIVLENVALNANDTSNGTYEELAQQILLVTQ